MQAPTHICHNGSSRMSLSSVVLSLIKLVHKNDLLAIHLSNKTGQVEQITGIQFGN